MRIESRIGYKDFIRVTLIASYNNPWVVLSSIAGLIGMIVFLWLFISGTYLHIQSGPHPMGIFFCAFIAFWIPFKAYFSAKAKYTGYEDQEEVIIYDFTEEGMRIIGDNGYMDYDWENIDKIVELRDCVFIYHNHFMVNPILRQSFSTEEFAEFKELVWSKSDFGFYINFKT